MKQLLAGTVFFLLPFSLPCSVFSQTAPLTPPTSDTNETIRVVIQYAYVYESEVVTNADHSVTWVKHATATNVVNRYAPMIIMRERSRESLTSGEWEYTGKEWVSRLGTNSAAFYDIEVSIE
jgi:hypothetical protein